MDPNPIAPGANESIKTQIINDNFSRVQNKLVTNIIKDENGIPKMIIGKLPDGTYGLVIAKDGIDVLTVFS